MYSTSNEFSSTVTGIVSAYTKAKEIKENIIKPKEIFNKEPRLGKATYDLECNLSIVRLFITYVNLRIDVKNKEPIINHVEVKLFYLFLKSKQK